MTRHTAKVAKRANRTNPRQERNLHIIPNPETERVKRVQLIPRNLSQENYIDALRDPSKHIVIATGCAGTGKTLLATLYAIGGWQDGIYRKIVVTRPAVSVDEAHGFLPGTLLQKLEPWCVAVLDILKEHIPVPRLKKLLEDEVIELAALAYMRGRNLKHSIIIFDEAQNALPSQMKMVMTRLAEGSKLVITGDLDQHDRGYEANGLTDFIERLGKTESDTIATCRFEQRDIERHPVIDEVLRVYSY